MNTPLPPDHHTPHDDALPDEAALAALYRKLPKSEPGPMLDAAVLRAAAEAISREPSRTATPAIHARARKPHVRWLIPLSSAATLVLAAGLAWHMRDMPAAGAPTASKAPVAAPEAVTVASPSAGAPPVTDALSADTPPPPAQGMAVTEHRNGIVGSPPAPAQRRPAPDRLLAAASAMKPEKKTSDREMTARASATIAESEPLPQDDALAKAQPSPAVESSGEARIAAQFVARDEAEAPRMAPASMAAPAPVLEAAPAMMSAAPQAAAPAMPASADTTRNTADTPEQELAKIRLLFERHHDDEGTTRLIAFHRDHPDTPLPADLRTRLTDHP
jgi:Meckel syndrome type 1 protein